LPLLAVALGWGLPGVVGLLIGARAIALVIFLVLCLREFPTLKRVPRFTTAEARTLLGFGGWFTVTIIVTPLLAYVDRFLIGTLLSVAAVAYYVAPYEMVTRLWIVPASLVATLFPAFTALASGGRLEQAQDIALRSVKFLLVILGPIVVTLAVFAHDVLRLWLGITFAQQATGVVRVLAVGVLIAAVAQVPYSQLQAAGRPDLTAKFHLAELPLHVALVWLLVRGFGITGAAIAASTRMILDACLLFIAARSMSPFAWSSIKAHRVPQAAVVLLALALGSSLVDHMLHSRPLRVPAIAALLLVVTGVVWRYVLDENDRRRVVGLARSFYSGVAQLQAR